MTEQPTIIPDRAAAARAARSRLSQQRWAERLAAAGWTCTPPAPPAVELWRQDAAAQIAAALHLQTLVVDSGGPIRVYVVRSFDGADNPPDGVANRVTLTSHPSHPVVVEVAVHVVRGDVP